MMPPPRYSDAQFEHDFAVALMFLAGAVFAWAISWPILFPAEPRPASAEERR